MKLSLIKIKNALINEFECIEILYIFGSAKNGNIRPGSDIDLGVFIDKNTLKNNPMLGLEIEVFLQGIFNIDVDVVIMNKANSVLKYEILNTGVKLYEKNSYKRSLTELCITKDYFDLKYYQDKRIYNG